MIILYSEQRVGVLSALFMLLMVSNAMWYGTGANSDVAFKFQLGPLRYGSFYFTSHRTHLMSYNGILFELVI